MKHSQISTTYRIVLKAAYTQLSPCAPACLHMPPVLFTTMSHAKSPTKRFRRNSNKEREHFYDMCLRVPQTPAYLIDSEDDDDDTRSIETFSTTATVDDNPGTGRVLDKYFYQPAGRGIERLALRFTIRYLHPWRISEFLNVFARDCFHVDLEERFTLETTLHYSDSSGSRGSTTVAGLKSLVRQAQ